jgi:hypothetical protein
MMNQGTAWWERKGQFVSYPELKQLSLPHCVYASVAGAVNHMAGREVWTPTDLLAECNRRGHLEPNFGVGDVALVRVPSEVEKIHHNKDWSTPRLCAALIRQWIDDGAVVILSMELRNDAVSRRSGCWHMFTLMARSQDQFQVWDTNGGRQIGSTFFEGRGFLNEEEILSGFFYPNGWFFMPHDKEDTLVLMPKPVGKENS